MTAYSLPAAHATQDATAVVGRRIAAWAIDLAIYLGLLILFIFALLGGSNGLKQYDNVPSDFCTTWDQTNNGRCVVNNGTAVTVKINNGAVWLFWGGHLVAYALIQGLTGGSIGKLAVGLRVVTSDGQLCGIGRSFARTVLWIGDAITFSLPIVGGVLMLTTKGHRRLGDMAAGTYVVPKDAVGYAVVIPGVTDPVAAGYGRSEPAYPAYQSNPYQSGPNPPGDVGGPQWDQARNAYIQWDADQHSWLQYDDAAQRWKKIDT